MSGKKYTSATWRTQVIHEIMAKVNEEVESLRTEEQLGADLAYLFAAIADPGDGFVQWDIETGGLHVGVHHLFAQWFDATHPVWRFIRFES